MGNMYMVFWLGVEEKCSGMLGCGQCVPIIYVVFGF